MLYSFGPRLNIPSPLVAKLRATVNVNGVYIPFNEAPNSLRRFIRPSSFHNADTQYELSFSGTCFLARHHNNYFLIATQHQLVNSNREAPEVCIAVKDDPLSGGKLMVSPSQSSTLSFGDINYKFAEDLLFLQFEPPRYNTEIVNLFYGLDNIPDLSEVELDRVLILFTVGYPTQFIDYDIDFTNPEEPILKEIRQSYCKLYLEFSPECTMEYHRTLRVHSKMPLQRDVDFDGFSGSPVFFLHQDKQQQ